MVQAQTMESLTVDEHHQMFRVKLYQPRLCILNQGIRDYFHNCWSGREKSVLKCLFYTALQIIYVCAYIYIYTHINMHMSPSYIQK